MLQHSDRFSFVQRASPKTDRSVRRNPALLRWREGFSRQQHVEENLCSSTLPLEHPSAETVLRWRRASRSREMEILYERCAGLDVHKKNVKACFGGPGQSGGRRKETRTYLTMTQDLLQMRDWLKEQGCTHIAMEATGVYWRPIYNLLEGDFEILVVNARHIKALPGRKTDVKDAGANRSA